MRINHHFHKYLYTFSSIDKGENHPFRVSHAMAAQNLNLDLGGVFRRIGQIAQKYWYTPVNHHHELKG